MKHSLIRYIRYVRTQPKSVKETHAAVISALLTLCVVFLYVLSTVYGGEKETSPAKDMPSPFVLTKEGFSSLLEKLKTGNTYSVENGVK